MSQSATVQAALASGEWVEKTDKRSGKTYYQHVASKRKCWDLSAELRKVASEDKAEKLEQEEQDAESEAAPETASTTSSEEAVSAALRSGEWVVKYSRKENRPFYLRPRDGRKVWDLRAELAKPMTNPPTPAPAPSSPPAPVTPKGVEGTPVTEEAAAKHRKEVELALRLSSEMAQAAKVEACYKTIRAHLISSATRSMEQAAEAARLYDDYMRSYEQWEERKRVLTGALEGVQRDCIHPRVDYSPSRVHSPSPPPNPLRGRSLTQPIPWDTPQPLSDEAMDESLHQIEGTLAKVMESVQSLKQRTASPRSPANMRSVSPPRAQRASPSPRPLRSPPSPSQGMACGYFQPKWNAPNVCDNCDCIRERCLEAKRWRRFMHA